MSNVTKLSASVHGDMIFWKKFEGLLLDGQFPLDRYLARDDSAATFFSQQAGHEGPVLIKIVRYGAIGWERRSASWTTAKQLQHANLVRVYACGLSTLEGLRVAYAVTDYPDARLTNVLQERCLTAEEGRELLLNCSEALDYLHQKGLVHTHVQPTDVVSIDEIIKLSSDHLMKAGQRDGARKPDPYTAPEPASEGYTPASDIWSLGVTMFQTLTGTLPVADEAATPGPKTPYSEIIRHCLATKPANRWTARQILTSLKSSSRDRVQAAQYEAARHVIPPAPHERPRPDGELGQPIPASRMAIAKYGIPVAVILLLGSVWLASIAGHHAAPASPESTPSMKPIPKLAGQADVDALKEKPSAFQPGPAANNAPKPTASRVISPPTLPDTRRQTWSVVVYTYSRADSAQRKAAEINRKWPSLQARVLETKGGSLHLVVVGSETNRDAALKLHAQALASGLPRGSYIQNF